MALSSEDYRKLYSAETVVEVREKSLMYNLFSGVYGRQRSEWEGGANSVFIPIPQFEADTSTDPDEGVVVRDRSRGGDWPTASVPDAGRVTLTRSNGKGGAVEILMEDAGEVAWDIVGRYRSSVEYQVRHSLDTGAYDAIAALPSTTVTVGTGGSHFIARIAPYKSTIPEGDQSPIVQAIEDFSLRAYRANLVDGQIIAGSTGTPFMIFPPELALVLRRDLRALGLSLDALTAETLTQNVGIADPQTTQFIGSLMGVRLFSWNHLAVPSAGNMWPLYAAVPAAAALAVGGEEGVRVATQFLPPGENQVSTKPAYLFRQVVDSAYAEVVDNFHFKYRIEEV